MRGAKRPSALIRFVMEMSSWLFQWLFEFLSFLVCWWRKMEINWNEHQFLLLHFPTNFVFILHLCVPPPPGLYPPVCTPLFSVLIAPVATQNRAPPVRGERCCLGIDWARHALWWLMLKRFLTKRICKRRVTHRAFLHSSIPGGGPPRTGTVKPLSFYSWLIDRMLEEG